MALRNLKIHISERVSADGASDRVFTVPNFLSLLRILLIPLAIYFFTIGNDFTVIVIIIFCSVSDFLDGYIARKFHQITKIGRILDPVADRLLIFISLIMLTARDSLPIWFVLAVLIRETVLFFQYFQLVTNGREPIRVKLVGKFGAAGLMLGIPLLFLTTSEEILNWANSVWGSTAVLENFAVVAHILLLISLLIYWVAGLLYCWDAARILVQEPNKSRILLSALVTAVAVALVATVVLLIFPEAFRIF